MSLRIKLPPVKPSPFSTMTEHSEVRRKSTKRVATIMSDDEEIENNSVLSSPPTKKQRLDDSQDVDDNGFSRGGSPEIDVEGDDLGALVSTSMRSPVRQRRPTFKKLAGGMASSKNAAKSRKAMLSDADSDDYSLDAEAIAEDLDTLNDDGDEYFAEERKKPSKSRAGLKGKQSKGSKGSKGKGKGELQEKQILVKDERQGLSGQAGSTSKRPRQKPILNLDTDLVDERPEPAVVSATEIPGPARDVPDSAASSMKEASPPPKRKLPPIKKNKAPGPGTPASASTKPLASTGSTTKLANTESDTLTPATPVARVPAALQGATDFDLRDRSVYDVLFKNAGGNTPRSGLNRREKEEQRRKELNKMRDEAKAKRALESKHTFDLQAQMDKICRFEEHLRRANSAALFPNILGGKLKELWEQERRSRHSVSRTWEAQDAREEGEM